MSDTDDLTPAPWNFAMAEALALAALSAAEDEVPVGAVVVRNTTGEIIGRGRDQKMALSDPTAHAEIAAIRQAAAAHGDWRLEDCTLVVTLEPCPMCAGAAIMARMSEIVYGADNPKFGAIATQVNLPAAARWNHTVKITSGVMASQCAEILTSYFRAKRRSANGE